MFTPKYPPQDTAPAQITPAAVVHHPAPYAPVSVPVPAAPGINRPTLQLAPGSALALVASGSALVVIIGAVLVSMLLAVAITAASVAVCAVTVRSILKSDRR
jgi:hypothetical protein